MDRMLQRLRKMFGWTKPTIVDGKYIPELDREGNQKCPCCGDSKSLSIKSFLVVKCNTCYSLFKNYGKYGWESIEKEEPKTVAA